MSELIVMPAVTQIGGAKQITGESIITSIHTSGRGIRCAAHAVFCIDAGAVSAAGIWSNSHYMETNTHTEAHLHPFKTVAVFARSPLICILNSELQFFLLFFYYLLSVCIYRISDSDIKRRRLSLPPLIRAANSLAASVRLQSPLS